ncbi:MAG: nicotinate-nucleotide--dimethylbenzimidazole phosphoribosyltransferase [Sporomusaceae bacterium]|nr:nicotinate-nucleotide--dimethylbenzimidazole phosphoribosyltransferase [Sporomusaceae bacterium]
MNQLQQTIDRIKAPAQQTGERMRCRVQHLTAGSLGRIETMFGRYTAICGQLPPPPPRACMVVACADHGVAAHSISAYPIETTLQMTANYLISKGGSANAFANFSGSDMVVVDAGVAGDLSHVPGLWHRNIAYGTADFTKGPAMTRQQALQSLRIGLEIVEDRVRQGYNCFSLGEMGIGNTTSSAAIVAAFTGLDAETVAGRGTGISDSRMQVKIEVIRQGLAVNRPDPGDGLDVLTKVGGFEMGTLAGVVLGAAAHNCAVIIDGSNTTAAALLAAAMQPLCKQYLFASHLSGEPAHRHALALLDLKPCVDMGVRLGEAIGASVVVDMLRAVTAALPELERQGTAGTVAMEKTSPGPLPATLPVPTIRPLDLAAMEACQLRLDNLTKPLASLNAFEDLARQLAGITANPRPNRLRKAILTVTDGDCGEMVVNAFASHAAAGVRRLDIAAAVAGSPDAELTQPTLLRAMRAGEAAARSLVLSGVQVVGLGAAGLPDRGSTEIFLQTALTLEVHSADVLLPMLAKTGSPLLAGLAGAILGTASAGAAVVLDNLETVAAAWLAAAVDPDVKAYLIASHCGVDPVQLAALDKLSLRPHLELELVLGDGTGAVFGFRLLDAALHVLSDMKTFGEAAVAVAQDGPGALRQTHAVRD